MNILKCLVFVYFIGVVTACTDNVIDIHSKDTASFTTFETSVPVGRDNSLRLKLRRSRVDGRYRQNIPDGKMIIIDNDQIRGVTDVSGETDLSYDAISLGSDNILVGPDDITKAPCLSFYVGLSQT